MILVSSDFIRFAKKLKAASQEPIVITDYSCEEPSMATYALHNPRHSIIEANGKKYKITKRYFRPTAEGIEQANMHDIWENVEPESESMMVDDNSENAPQPLKVFTKPKKGYWTDDLTRLAEAKKIRTVSGAKLRVKVENASSEYFRVFFKDYEKGDWYHYKFDGKIRDTTHFMDIAKIWLRNE